MPLLIPISLGVLFVFLALFLWFIATLTDTTTQQGEIAEQQLPRRVRRQLELAANRFSNAGFTEFTDLRIKRRGITIFGRYFLHRDRTIVAELVIHKLFGVSVSKLELAMTSVRQDGTVLQSSSHPSVPPFMRDLSEVDRVVLNATGSIEPDEMMRLHRQFTADHADDTQLLAFERHLVPNVNEYVMQLCEWFLHRKGLAPEPPPTADAAYPIQAMVAGASS